MEKKKLDIIGISGSQTQSGAYALVLAESDGNRRLPIIIGAFEAQSIAIELEQMKPQRPLTHDLFLTFSRTFNIDIKEVIINKFSEGIFYAELVTFDGKKEIRIDARTSDAVALAIRFKCPVYAYSDVLDQAGIIMDDLPDEEIDEKQIKQDPDDDLLTIELKELEELLAKAISNEEYEKASNIRDEIKRREKNQ